VYFSETTNADGLAKIYVTGYGSGADVVPVRVLRWEFVGVAGLDGVDPRRDWQSALSL